LIYLLFGVHFILGMVNLYIDIQHKIQFMQV